MIENVLSVLTYVDDNEECSFNCEDRSNCLSYDYSESQKRCILHSSIEGPPTLDSDGFVNTYETLPIQASQDYAHYEALGKGHSTLYNITGMELQHGQNFFVNLRLHNKLGYTNVISSTSVMVDLTPPTPGRVRNFIETFEKIDCDSNIEQRCSGEMTPIDNHRYFSIVLMQMF